MRGSRELVNAHHVYLGIIPAHAGLTQGRCIPVPFRRDHPRACGAHRSASSRTAATAGSSPRMRGSLQLMVVAAVSLGIIPAHAGLTRTSSAGGTTSWDHPRACGAHIRHDREAHPAWGSSPRMRGSPNQNTDDGPRQGIIPAHAGLTRIRRIKNGNTGDHPRACGAHS